MGPYAHHLLEDVPDDTPAGASVMRVEFTNQGAGFREWQARLPERTGRRWLVGVARRIDGNADGTFPVYAWPSSCTPDFFDFPSRPIVQQTYLVGRFETLGGERVFIAISRGSEGGWEAFEAGRTR